MPRAATITRAGFASGMIMLAVIGLAFHDFNLVWGPVPSAFPQGAALAVACALVTLLAGLALVVRRTAAVASQVLFAYVALWWVAIKVPPVLRAPLTELTWLDCGMFAVLLAGAWTLYAEFGARRLLAGERGTRFARRLFGLALIPTGLSHFAYVSLTVPLIPAWIPFPYAWAYVTGACHIAAGLGVLFGVQPRLAAHLESVMLALFTALVWVPRVVAAPATRGNWTEFWISWALTAAAAVVAARIPARGAPGLSA
jgi:uncharacterized membrane protein